MKEQDLLEQLTTLIEANQSGQVIFPYDTGLFSVSEALLAEINSMLQRSLTLLDQVLDRFDPEPGGDTAPSSDTGEHGFSQVAAAAFFARGKVQSALEDLERATEANNQWKMAALADTGKEQALRGLIAVEEALRESLGFPSEDRQWHSLDDALETRRLYAQFRRTILRGGTPTQDTLHKRLRKVAHRIAILRDLKIYPFIRIEDRREIRRLQKRILAWLETEATAKNLQEGQHLWQDLENFAELLRQINLRQVLVEHDQQILNDVHRSLFRGPAPAENLTPRAIRELDALHGRDEELDELLLFPGKVQPAQLRPVLERLIRSKGSLG